MKYFFALLFVSTSTFASSQILRPVMWKHIVTKDANNIYKVTFKATIDLGWHIYSKVQPKKAIAQPLVLSFSRNANITLQGNSIEVGKIIKGYDKTINVEDNHYSKNMEIYQLFKIKNSSPVKLSGVLTYQTCNSTTCLAPEDYDFSITLK